MRSKQSIAIIGLTLLFSVACVIAEQSEFFPMNINLSNACMLARTNNPGMQSMREQLVQQDGVLIEAKARSRPHLSADGIYQTFDDGRLQSFGDEFSPDSSRWDASLDASLTVFSGGRNYHYIKGEQAQLKSIAAAISSTEQNLLTLVHRTYYRAWLADQRIVVQEEAIAVFKEQLQVAENLFNAGVGEKYDVTQARVALANAHPTLIRAQNDRRRSIDRLQELIGLPYPPESNAKNVQLDALPEFKPMNMLLNNAMTTAIKNRPEREKIQHDLETAERRLHVETAGQTPEVNLFADYGAESDMFGSGTSLEGWSAGVRLSWDLFDGGSRRGKMQQARSVLKQLQHQDAELKLTIEGEVRKAYYDQQEAAAILATSADIIEQAREALQLAQDRYKAGKGTQLEVLESRLQLTRAQLEASTARHDMALAAVQMKRAIGNSL